jgi:hypothetical protein
VSSEAHWSVKNENRCVLCYAVLCCGLQCTPPGLIYARAGEMRAANKVMVLQVSLFLGRGVCQQLRVTIFFGVLVVTCKQCVADVRAVLWS